MGFLLAFKHIFVVTHHKVSIIIIHNVCFLRIVINGVPTTEMKYVFFFFFFFWCKVTFTL